MRLINGHRKTGLTGMESNAGFPECRGIYGVHESGDQAESALFYPNTFLRELPFPPQLLTEAGGLRLHRPMLSFPKSRLIATCQAENMEWFEDVTNKDPTLTTRNAIRHIYNSYTMPAALSKPAILRLAERAKGEPAKQQEIIDYYLSLCEISDFQTRSGLVRIRFPTLDLPSTLSQEGKEAIGANIIRHIIMLVTPLENVPISGLSLTTKRIFPELYPNENIERKHRFSVANLDIRYGKDDTYLQKPTYLISRAPYHKNNFPFLPSPETSETQESQESPWSEWRLFDGRYWIRIKNKTTHPILIRPFLPTDSKYFESNLSQASYMKLNQLSTIAPAKMKWTLPCLVLQEGFLSGGDTKKEKVLALPSFDVGIQDAEKFVEYEIKYKKIYWGALKNTIQEPPSRAVALDTTPPPIVRVIAGDIKGGKKKKLIRYNDCVEPKGDEKEKPLIRKHYVTKVLEVPEKPLIRYHKTEMEKSLIRTIHGERVIQNLIRYSNFDKKEKLITVKQEKKLQIRKHATDGDQKQRQVVRMLPTEESPAKKEVEELIPHIEQPPLIPHIPGVVGKPGEIEIRRVYSLGKKDLGESEREERNQAGIAFDERMPGKIEGEETSQEEIPFDEKTY